MKGRGEIPLARAYLEDKIGFSKKHNIPSLHDVHLCFSIKLSMLANRLVPTFWQHSVRGKKCCELMSFYSCFCYDWKIFLTLEFTMKRKQFMCLCHQCFRLATSVYFVIDYSGEYTFLLNEYNLCHILAIYNNYNTIFLSSYSSQSIY